MKKTKRTKENAPHKAGREENKTQTNFADVSANAQRGRLLRELEKGPVSTLEARCKLDILHPAMRVLELREQGYDIQTVWTRQITLPGVRHRVARYVLRAKRGKHDA